MTQPVNSFDARRGSNVTFSVEATGLRLSYIWQHTDEVPLTGDRFIGVDSSELTIKDVALGDAGLYVCVVSNGAGSVRSEGAMLTISKFMLHIATRMSVSCECLQLQELLFGS